MAYEITPGSLLSLKFLSKNIFSTLGLLSFQAAGKELCVFGFVFPFFWFFFFLHKVHHQENLLSTLETYNNYFLECTGEFLLIPEISGEQWILC